MYSCASAVPPGLARGVRMSVTGLKDTARGHFVCRRDTRLGKQRGLRPLTSSQRLRRVWSLTGGSAPRAVWMAKLLTPRRLARSACRSRGEDAAALLGFLSAFTPVFVESSNDDTDLIPGALKLVNYKFLLYDLLFKNTLFWNPRVRDLQCAAVTNVKDFITYVLVTGTENHSLLLEVLLYYPSWK